MHEMFLLHHIRQCDAALLPLLRHFYYISTVILKVLVRLLTSIVFFLLDLTHLCRKIYERRSCVFTRMNKLMDPFATSGYPYFTGRSLFLTFYRFFTFSPCLFNSCSFRPKSSYFDLKHTTMF